MKVIFRIAAVLSLGIDQSYAADEQDLTRLTCEEVTLDYNSRQIWQPGETPYGILYEEWTPQTFDVLRERAVACSNPDAQSFIAYVTYLERTNADAIKALEDNRRQKALAEAEAKRQAELKAARVRADLAAERARALRRAAEEEEARKAELEAARAREQQETAEAERQRQRLLDGSTLPVDPETPPDEVAIDEPQPANPMFPLDEDVKIFVRNNPQLAQDVRMAPKDKLLIASTLFRNQAVVELSLMLCNERWADFPGQQEEASRRINLLRRVYFQYLGLPLEKFHEFRDAANQVFETTQTTDILLADLDSLYQICQQALLEVSYGFNFAQE